MYIYNNVILKKKIINKTFSLYYFIFFKNKLIKIYIYNNYFNFYK